MKTKPIASLSVISRAKELNDALKRLQKTQIFVGIATGSKGDKREDGGPDNHLLGFVHERGSPAANIPARPFLAPGVASGAEKIVPGLERTIKAALRNDEAAVEASLKKTGRDAVSAVKVYMTTADFVPLSPKYLKQRHRARLTKGKRANELKGKGVRPLINSGSLLEALDYYLEEH